MSRRPAGRRGTVTPPAGKPPRSLLPVAIALLMVHLALILWVATRNSVTFDENFHLPAGVVALTRADFSTSYAQPPLARALCGAAALAVGALRPDPAFEVPGGERGMGESFMRRNADRYVRVFFAGRFVIACMSVALGLLIWQLAARWYGPPGGIVAFAAWTLSPEALAHASVVGVDIPTALVFLGATWAGVAWLRTGRWRAWGVCAAWIAAAFLVRFSAVQLFLILGLLAAGYALLGRLASARRTLAGLALLVVVAVLAVNAGYLFQGTGMPLSHVRFTSPAFQAIQRTWGSVPSPLPEPYLLGLEYLSYLSQAGIKASYFLGRVVSHHEWGYFPVAIAAKWPVGLLALLLLRAVRLAWTRRARADRELALLVPASVVLFTAISANLDYGVRYVLPALPFLCVWAGGLAGRGQPRPRRAGPWPALALALVAVEAFESVRALPYPLAFFNAFAGGLGRGDRIVNDSNVDWGQGLVALREELRARGIRRVHLLYHGTTNPSLYGIDWVPFLGGAPGPESDWLAVSSYFLVGLPARVETRTGFTPQLMRFDLSGLIGREPAARPGGCIYLYRIR